MTTTKICSLYACPSLVARLVKNPPTVRETWVWSLGWEDPLEKGKATHSSILAWATEYSTVLRIMYQNTELRILRIQLRILSSRPEYSSILENSMENPMDCIVQSMGSQRLGHDCATFTFTFAKEMAAHSSILAWKIPWTEEPGRLQSTG